MSDTTSLYNQMIEAEKKRIGMIAALPTEGERDSKTEKIEKVVKNLYEKYGRITDADIKVVSGALVKAGVLPLVSAEREVRAVANKIAGVS